MSTLSGLLGTLLTRLIVPAWVMTGAIFKLVERDASLLPKNLFDIFVKQLGLPRIPLKNLRHTHATLALEAGVHPKVVSERLGHATVAFTLDCYSHAVPAMEEQAAEQIAALVRDA